MNTITHLFSAGNPVFMTILTLILLISLYLFSTRWFSLSATSLSKLSIKDLGLLAFVIGVAAQLSGLYAMFGALQEMGNVAPAMIYGGLGVSLIAPIYGAFILSFNLVIEHLLKMKE